tara:strand:- start:517 stop:651 length:135 start_codon:yes stop_codon:yes gene_type:complete
MKKYKVTIKEEFTVEAEDEASAVWDALEGLDLGSITPDIEEIKE